MGSERSLISVILALLSVLCLILPNDSKTFNSLQDDTNHPNIDTAILNDEHWANAEVIRAVQERLNRMHSLRKQYEDSLSSNDYGNDEEKYQYKEKRGRFQGFCFRRARNGRKLPYICWRDAE